METIRINVADKHLCEALQKALFELGYGWHDAGRKVSYINDMTKLFFIRLNGHAGRTIGYGYHNFDSSVYDYEFTLPQDWNAALAKAKEVLEVKPKLWEPTVGKMFFTTNAEYTNGVNYRVWQNHRLFESDVLLKHHNVFPTEEKAIQVADRERAQRHLERIAEAFGADVKRSSNRLGANRYEVVTEYKFKHEPDRENALEMLGDDIKHLKGE